MRPPKDKIAHEKNRKARLNMGGETYYREKAMKDVMAEMLAEAIARAGRKSSRPRRSRAASQGSG